MLFWKDLVLPIVILIGLVGLISFVLNLILRAIKLDMTIIRIICFFAIWYYVGPIVYNWMVDGFISYEHEAIRILFMPIQYIMQALKKLV